MNTISITDIIIALLASAGFIYSTVLLMRHKLFMELPLRVRVMIGFGGVFLLSIVVGVLFKSLPLFWGSIGLIAGASFGLTSYRTQVDQKGSAAVEAAAQSQPMWKRIAAVVLLLVMWAMLVFGGFIFN